MTTKRFVLLVFGALLYALSLDTVAEGVPQTRSWLARLVLAVGVALGVGLIANVVVVGRRDESLAGLAIPVATALFVASVLNFVFSFGCALGMDSCSTVISKGPLFDEFNYSSPSFVECRTASDPDAIVDWLRLESVRFGFGPPTKTPPRGACKSADSGAAGPLSSLNGSVPPTDTSTDTSRDTSVMDGQKIEHFSLSVATFGTGDVAGVKNHWMKIYSAREQVDRNSRRTQQLREGLENSDLDSVDVQCEKYLDWCQVYLVRGDVFVTIDVVTGPEHQYPPGTWNDPIFALVDEIDRALVAAA